MTSNLDDKLQRAAADLRGEIDRLDPPDFRPTRAKTPAVLVLVLLLGVGIVGFVARPFSGDDGGISVATKPDVPEQVATPDSTSAAVEPTETPADAAAPIHSTPRLGRLTAARPGEFFVPLSLEAAWSPDETRLVIYRTGETQPGHVVIDTASGEQLAVLPFDPADIEQVYWHPHDNDRLLYTDGAALMSYSLQDDESIVLHQFDGCDRVDSGAVPVPPSADGTVSLLCHASDDREQVTYHLVTEGEQRSVAESDVAAFPSPSGSYFVRWADDGSHPVLTSDLRDTGVMLPLGESLPGFVATGDGREWVAATVFDGSVIGSLVLFPLDGLDNPFVVIGPDAGDVYPPVGTRISAVGTLVALSIKGPDDGSLAGRLSVVDVSGPSASRELTSLPTGVAEAHGYWSSPFVSLSPSGRYVAYSTDEGSDRVDTFIVASSG